MKLNALMKVRINMEERSASVMQTVLTCNLKWSEQEWQLPTFAIQLDMKKR